MPSFCTLGGNPCPLYGKGEGDQAGNRSAWWEIQGGLCDKNGCPVSVALNPRGGKWHLFLFIMHEWSYNFDVNFWPWKYSHLILE